MSLDRHETGRAEVLALKFNARLGVGGIDEAGGNASAVGDAVDGERDRRGGGTADERESLHTLGAGDRQCHAVGDRAGSELQISKLGAADHVDVNGHRYALTDLSLGDVQSGDRAGVDAAGDVAEASIQKIEAGETGGASDARNGLHVGVNLKLVGLKLGGRERAGVGRLDDQALNIIQERRDVGEGGIRGGDDVLRLRAVGKARN